MNIRNTASCSDGWNRPWMENKEKDKLRQEIAIEKANNLGRFPANTILTYDDTDYEEVCGGFPYTKSKGAFPKKINGKSNITFRSDEERESRIELNDSGSASRYYYNAKASKRDRDEGLEEFEEKKVNDGRKKEADNAFQRGKTLRHNNHPTVKPTSLMQYLVRLVTPKGGTILDPFMGSGSTGKAVAFENKDRQADYSFIGIERESEYCDIAKARIEWASRYEENQPKTIEEVEQIKFDDLEV